MGNEKNRGHCFTRQTHSFFKPRPEKRVAIAGVLAMNPDVFILDEPSAGLDAYYSKQIMQILREIHESTKTIILSTHDVHFAYEWADEIIVMSDGNSFITGPCDRFSQSGIT